MHKSKTYKEPEQRLSNSFHANSLEPQVSIILDESREHKPKNNALFERLAQPKKYSMVRKRVDMGSPIKYIYQGPKVAFGSRVKPQTESLSTS